MHQNISGIASELSPNNPILKDILLMIYRNNGKEQMDRFIAEYKGNTEPNKSIGDKLIDFMSNLPDMVSKSITKPVNTFKQTKIGQYVLMTWVDYQIKKKLKDGKSK